MSPRSVAQSVARLTKESEEPGSTPDLAHYFVKTDHEIFSTIVFPLPLIQGGQLIVLAKEWLTA